MTTRAPHPPSGPETWERLLFALWDRVEGERRRGGKAIAAQLAQRALEAIEAPAEPPAQLKKERKG